MKRDRATRFEMSTWGDVERGGSIHLQIRSRHAELNVRVVIAIVRIQVVVRGRCTEPFHLHNHGVLKEVEIVHIKTCRGRLGKSERAEGRIIINPHGNRHSKPKSVRGDG